MSKPDRKTAEIVSNEERVARFVQSDDWRYIKSQLIHKIVLNDSVSTIIPNIPPDKLLTEILARAQASAILLEWLREIEGTANQVNDSAPLMAEERTTQILTYFEKPER